MKHSWMGKFPEVVEWTKFESGDIKPNPAFTLTCVPYPEPYSAASTIATSHKYLNPWIVTNSNYMCCKCKICNGVQGLGTKENLHSLTKNFPKNV